MYIKDGVNTDYQIRVAKEYQANTTLALDWFKTADGNHRCTDLGVSGDIHEAIISTYGTESYINNIISNLDSIRTASYLSLYDFASDEKIFGENIDYDTYVVSACYVGYNRRKTTSFRGHSLEIGFRAVSPSFVSSEAFSWNSISCIAYDYSGDRLKSINNIDSYYGKVYSYDTHTDTGEIEFTTNMTSSGLISLRNFQRSNRGASFVLPSGALVGIAYPFGVIAGGGPHNVRLLDMKEQRFSLDRFNVTIKLAQER